MLSSTAAIVAMLVAALVLVAVLAGLSASFLSTRNRLRDESQLRKDDVERLKSQLARGDVALEALRREVTLLGAEKARLEERLEAEKTALEKTGATLEEKFRSLAATALQENNAAFLGYARQELVREQIVAKAAFDEKESAIAALLEPMKTSLNKLSDTTQQLEVKREGAYFEVKTLIEGIQQGQMDLRKETTQLVQALRTPRVRGSWGELQLKKCIEFAGMVEHASFDVQVSVSAGEDRLRPDCVIHLPNQRTIVIDAKTPFDAFLDAAAATDETTRALKMTAHSARVRQHLNDLSSKSYWRQFRDSPDFVVCFLSAEVLFSAALEYDPGLIEHGASSKVILATPTTLIALLKAVAYGWQQMDITRNAIAIRQAGQDLYNKLAVAHEHFLNMGKAITASVRHYNSLVGSVEGKGSVFSLARNMGAMGVGQIEIGDVPPIELATRDLKADDWIPGLLPGSVEDEE